MQAAMESLLTPSWPTALALVPILYAAYFLLGRPPFPPNAPPLLEALPIIGALRFFSNRNLFLREVAAWSPSRQASFYFGKFRIVALSGEDGRRAFFESRELDFNAGYAVLFNAAPKIPAEKQQHQSDLIKRSLARFLRRESLAPLVPSLTSDCLALTTRLSSPASLLPHPASPPTGLLNPFHDVYRLVYRLTMRTLGCREIADDETLLETTLAAFEGIDGAGVGSKLLFPWAPTLGEARRVYAGARMYKVFKGVVEGREREGRREGDPLQVLIDQGLSLVEMVTVIIASLFAGLINTGMNAAWLLTFLAENPPWLSAVREEVDRAVARHRTGPEQTPADVLATLALEDWEGAFPALDACLRETIRFTITGCGFRANASGGDVEIGNGEVIPDGAFAVYLWDDVLMNPDIYKDPYKWDPGRHGPGRADDQKIPHGYIGWGSGRHPCLGMRFAKLEVTVLAALFVSAFDFSLVDDKGEPARTSPASIDRSKHQVSGPTHPLFLKYKVR